jgi:serine/threonine protein kinase
MKKYDMDLYQLLSNEILDIVQIYSLSNDIISAVVYLHSNGIIHADLKPQNILINRDSSGLTAVVCDLGLSTVRDEKYHLGSVQTVIYRAPEIIGDLVRVRFRDVIDMWSIGCIMYEMVQRDRVGIPGQTDSVDCAWEFFGLGSRATFNRRDKLNILNTIDKGFVEKHLLLRFDNSAISLDYVKLIARCLIPDYTKRITSQMANRAIKHIARDDTLIIEYTPRAAIPPQLRDIISPLYTVNPHLINQCLSPECFSLAEQIYDVLPDAYSQDTKASISLYISGCLFTGSTKLTLEIQKIISFDELIKDIKPIICRVVNSIMNRDMVNIGLLRTG